MLGSGRGARSAGGEDGRIGQLGSAVLRRKVVFKEEVPGAPQKCVTDV